MAGKNVFKKFLLMGQYHEIFLFQFLSSINPPWVNGSHPKIIFELDFYFAMIFRNMCQLRAMWPICMYSKVVQSHYTKSFCI
jgi:hypothetical protein